MNFLISGIGRRNALIRMIRYEAEQFNVQLIGADANEFAPARYEFNKFILLPKAHDDKYKNAYRDVLLNEEVKAMITLIDPEIPQISRLSQELSLLSFHPDMDVVDLCEDKYQFAEEATHFGINVIKTQLSPFDHFPFIRKDRKGSGASGYKLINKPEDDSPDGRKVEFVYQPYCGAIHYCIDAYFSVYTGELIDFCVKQVLDKFRGESYSLKTIHPAGFLSLMYQISTWINLKGIVNFDIYEVDGQLKLVEINCRIGGNYPVSHSTGCNLLQYMFKELIDGRPVPQTLSKYQVDKIVVKYFDFSLPFDL